MATPAPQHRVLRFKSLADLEEELARIEAAERDGRLSTTGNWTPGQILNHIAAWVDFGYEGYPDALPTPPMVVRLMLRLMRRRFLRKPMPVGVRIPKVQAGTVGTEVVSFDEGLARLRRAIGRLRTGEAPPFPSPAFGRFSNHEAVLATLRHAELHLGFLKY